jgi:fatty acid desaturase
MQDLLHAYHHEHVCTVYLPENTGMSMAVTWPQHHRSSYTTPGSTDQGLLLLFMLVLVLCL